MVGYMKIGAVVHSEGYGSVESTEGDFVGGICGQSLSVIRNCYAISEVSGGKNVGGIAGYAEELTDCYSLARVEAAVGRSGAIAGQVSSYEKEEEEQQKVRNNFFAEMLFTESTASAMTESPSRFPTKKCWKAKKFPLLFAI